MLIDDDWCWLICWLMLIDAQIRFNRVFFCRSVLPELLRSFLSLSIVIFIFYFSDLGQSQRRDHLANFTVHPSLSFVIFLIFIFIIFIHLNLSLSLSDHGQNQGRDHHLAFCTVHTHPCNLSFSWRTNALNDWWTNFFTNHPSLSIYHMLAFKLHLGMHLSRHMI